MGHLSQDNLIWLAAIISNQKLKLCSKLPEIHQNGYLQDNLSTGILDCKGGEQQDNTEEKCMWYAAVCALFVFDHVTTLEQKVILKIFFVDFAY